MKYSLIDIETTGTDPKIHHIHQIAIRICNSEMETIASWSAKFRPFSLEGFTQEALDKCGLTYEELSRRPMLSSEAFAEMMEFLSGHCNRYDKSDKLQFVAYNARFDNDFVREWFTRMGDNYYGSWWWHPFICVMQAAAFTLSDHRDKIGSFSLESVCTACGIPWDPEKAHDADYDIDQTQALFKGLIS